MNRTFVRAIYLIIIASICLVATAIGAQAQTVRPTSYQTLQKQLETRPTQLLVVNFWATWCRPCVEELPHFERLGAEWADSGVTVVLVSLDDPEELATRVQPLVQRKGLKSELWLLADPDVNTWMPLVSAQWDGVIPATLFVPNNAWHNRSLLPIEFTYEELVAQVRQQLQQINRPRP